jgi:hypothetical protein
MNSAFVIFPSLSVSTDVKSVTYACACCFVSDPVAEASACFHRAVQSDGVVVWATAAPAATIEAVANPAARYRTLIRRLHPLVARFSTATKNPE